MRVSVETGCRLHLGFTNLSEDIGRCFGSIGVAIDRPGTSIVFEEHDELAIAGEDREPVRAAVRRFCDTYGVAPRVSITVKEHIPEHVGLGSGTQLALAVGVGLAAVCGIDADVREIAFGAAEGAAVRYRDRRLPQRAGSSSTPAAGGRRRSRRRCPPSCGGTTSPRTGAS